MRSFSIAPSEVFAQVGVDGGHAGELPRLLAEYRPKTKVATQPAVPRYNVLWRSRVEQFGI